MGKGSSKQTSTTTSQPPQIYLDAYKALMGQAKDVAGQPLQQYQGPTVADFSPSQQNAFGTVNNAQGMGMPYINAALGYTQQSANPLQYNTLSNSQMGDLAGGSLGNFAQAGQGTNIPQFSQGALDQYRNPYTQDVINSTLALSNQQDAQQQSALQGNAISKGAWGGDRAGVAQAELAGQQGRNRDSLIAGLNNQNYSQALGQFNQQQGLDVQSQQADAARRAQLASQGLGAYGQQGGLDLSGQQAQAWLNSNAASQLGQFGQEAFTQALQGAQAQLGTGALQQQQMQALMNVPYEQFLQRQAYPFQTTGWLGNLVEGLGSQSGGTSTTTTPGASGSSQLLGGLGAAGGLIGGLSGKGSDAMPGMSMSARGGRIGMADGGDVGDMLDYGDAGMTGFGGGGKGGGMLDNPLMLGLLGYGLYKTLHKDKAKGNPQAIPGSEEGMAGGGIINDVIDPNKYLNDLLGGYGAHGSGSGGQKSSIPQAQTTTTSGGGGKGGGILGTVLGAAKLGVEIAALKRGGRTMADGGAVDDDQGIQMFTPRDAKMAAITGQGLQDPTSVLGLNPYQQQAKGVAGTDENHLRQMIVAAAGDRQTQAQLAELLRRQMSGRGINTNKANPFQQMAKGGNATSSDPWAEWESKYGASSSGIPSIGNMGKGSTPFGVIWDQMTSALHQNSDHPGSTTASTPYTKPDWLKKLVPDSLSSGPNSDYSKIPSYAQMGLNVDHQQSFDVPSNLISILQDQGAPGYALGGPHRFTGPPTPPAHTDRFGNDMSHPPPPPDPNQGGIDLHNWIVAHDPTFAAQQAQYHQYMNNWTPGVWDTKNNPWAPKPVTPAAPAATPATSTPTATPTPAAATVAPPTTGGAPSSMGGGYGIPSNLMNILHAQGAPGYAPGGFVEGDENYVEDPDPFMAFDPLRQAQARSQMLNSLSDADRVRLEGPGTKTSYTAPVPPKPFNAGDYLQSQLKSARDTITDPETLKGIGNAATSWLGNPSSIAPDLSGIAGIKPPASPSPAAPSQGIAAAAATRPMPPPAAVSPVPKTTAPPPRQTSIPAPPKPTPEQAPPAPQQEEGIAEAARVAEKTGTQPGTDWWDKFQKSPWFLVMDAGLRTMAGTSPDAGVNIGEGISGAVESYGKNRQHQADEEARQLLEQARDEHVDKREDARLAEEKRYHDMTATDKGSLQEERLYRQQQWIANAAASSFDPGEADADGHKRWMQQQQAYSAQSAEIAKKIAALTGTGGGDTSTIVPPVKVNGITVIKSNDEYKALPSGTAFIGPDGKKRIKP